LPSWGAQRPCDSLADGARLVERVQCARRNCRICPRNRSSSGSLLALIACCAKKTQEQALACPCGKGEKGEFALLFENELAVLVERFPIDLDLTVRAHVADHIPMDRAGVL
jgi:hypothetical protein